MSNRGALNAGLSAAEASPEPDTWQRVELLEA